MESNFKRLNGFYFFKKLYTMFQSLKTFYSSRQEIDRIVPQQYLPVLASNPVLKIKIQFVTFTNNYHEIFWSTPFRKFKLNIKSL